MRRKTIVISFVFCMIFSFFSNSIVLATEYTQSINGNILKVSSADDIISGANGFVNAGESEAQGSINQSKLVETSNSLYNILLAIAMIVAVAVGVTLGIKFMISSVEEQAKIKELLIPYVVSCIVIFGAMGIWKLAVNTFSKF